MLILRLIGEETPRPMPPRMGDEGDAPLRSRRKRRPPLPPTLPVLVARACADFEEEVLWTRNASRGGKGWSLSGG